jgi:lantibiotic modifying enzyme
MILDSSHLRKKDTAVILAVLKRIADFIVKNDGPSGTGLMGGRAGIMLFLAYYGLYIDKSYLPNVQKGIEGILDSVEKEEDISYSYAEGIMGISSFLCHLAEKKLVQQEQFRSEEVYSILSEYTIYQIENGKDELLYGAGGGIAFFLQDYLFSQSMQSYQRLQCFSKETYQRYKDNGNILPPSSSTGIAHGHSSWIILLSKLIDMGVCSDSNTLVLDSILKRYEPYLFSSDSSEGYFPNVIDQEGNAQTYWNRFGWCRGDISCLIAQLQCYEILNRSKEKAAALEKLVHLSNERNAELYHVHDSALCHGTGGLYMIFNWLSSKYQIEEFKIAGDFWLQKTLSPINFEDPYLGYRKRFFREDEEIVSEEMGFLEGISGIGLSLMASIGINDDWKKLLLVGIS